MLWVPTALNGPKATTSPVPDGTRSGDVPAGVLVRGALEEDDPETWDAHALGWAPEAESEGDRSLGRMRSGSRRAP